MKISERVALPKLHNHFELVVKDAATGEITQKARAENVVLDDFYHKIMSSDARYGGIRGIAVGRGTGEISPGRTSMFSQIAHKMFSGGATVVTTADLITVSGKIVIGSSEYVGETITEVSVGFGGNASSVSSFISHALLQDSEGNPLSIGPKTIAQIIEIFAVVYIQRTAGTPAFPNNITNWITSPSTSNWRALADTTNYTVGLLKPNGGPDFSLSGASYNTVTKSLTRSGMPISTAQMNTDIYVNAFPTQDIRGLMHPSNENGLWFPNADAFPEFTFSERTIGVGDGSNVWFDFDNGFIKPGSEIVKVGGVVKTRDVDYTIRQGGRQVLNYLRWGNPYGSNLEAYLYSTDLDKGNPVLFGLADASKPITATELAGKNAFMLDLGSVMRIGAIGIEKRSSNLGDVEMYRSSDGVNWTLVEKKASLGYTKPLFRNLHLFEMRYVWILGIYSYLERPLIFGAPTIQFLIAPPADELVTATWATGVPPKNANFSYTFSASIVGSW